MSSTLPNICQSKLNKTSASVVLSPVGAHESGS